MRSKTNIAELILISLILLFLPVAASASDYTLGIYGNANGDDTINMQDVTYSELIILEYRDQTALADAKYDGEVDILDVTQIELIILGKEKELTILDSADRTVTIDKPVEKIVVLWHNPPVEIRALGAIDRIVGIDTTTKKETEYFFPELTDVPVIGSWNEPDYEMIIDLDPDVVIMLSSFSPLPDEVQEILGPAGIKVVGLDFYMVEVFYKELAILGYILDVESEAEEYINFFKSWTDQVDEVVKDLNQDEKKTVYFEDANKYYSYGGAGYGKGIPGIVRAAGGVYIYDDIIEYDFEVDPEELIDRNPDVIFKGTGIGNMGYSLTNTNEYEQIREELVSRPELSIVTAVQNDDVYVINWGVAGGSRKIFGPVFMAKCLYPDKFEDLEPNDFIKEYLEEWQNIPYQGIYIYP